jgi:hypothetical protein
MIRSKCLDINGFDPFYYQPELFKGQRLSSEEHSVKHRIPGVDDHVNRLEEKNLAFSRGPGTESIPVPVINSSSGSVREFF